MPDSAALGSMYARLGQAGLPHGFLAEQDWDDLLSGPADIFALRLDRCRPKALDAVELLIYDLITDDTE